MGEPREYRLLVQPPDAAGLWVVVCLDPYLVAQGATIDEMARAFATLWCGQVDQDRAEGRAPFADLPPAPPQYQQRWQRAHGMLSRQVEGQAFAFLVGLDLLRQAGTVDARFTWRVDRPSAA